MGPVSYTHLDVYKRQALMAAFTAGTVVWNSPAISVAVIHTSLPVTPVSYTHLLEVVSCEQFHDLCPPSFWFAARAQRVVVEQGVYCPFRCV